MNHVEICETMKRDIIQLKHKHNSECSVCLCSMQHKAVKFLQCKHVFHLNCINKWLNKQNTCPLCRELVGNPYLTYDRNISTIIQEIIHALDVYPEYYISNEELRNQAEEIFNMYDNEY